MKNKFSMAAALLASVLAFQPSAHSQEAPAEKDTAITAMINSLSKQFENAAGYPLPEKRQEDFKKTLTDIKQNIREGYCRNIGYDVHHDGHDLHTNMDVCKMNGNLVPRP